MATKSARKKKKKGVKLGGLVSVALKKAERELKSLEKDEGVAHKRLILKVKKLKKVRTLLREICDGLYI